MIVVKVALKDLNPEKLGEELRALTFGGELGRVDWYGFERVTPRRITPILAPKKVGEANGVSDFADPGELRFHFARDLTAPEDAALDAALTAHLFSVLTAEQGRQDTDETDLDTLVTAAQQFNTFLASFDAAGNVSQLKTALRPFCVNVGRALRIIVRKYRSAQV